MGQQIVDLLMLQNQLLVDATSLVLGVVIALIIATAWRR